MQVSGPFWPDPPPARIWGTPSFYATNEQSNGPLESTYAIYIEPKTFSALTHHSTWFLKKLKKSVFDQDQFVKNSAQLM